jgi:hypothetical protein
LRIVGEFGGFWWGVVWCGVGCDRREVLSVEKIADKN